MLITSHEVNVETIQFHIFPTFSCFIQRLINMKMYDKQLYANVEDLLSVVKHASSLFDCLLECFSSNVQEIDLFAQRARKVGEQRLFEIIRK